VLEISSKLRARPMPGSRIAEQFFRGSRRCCRTGTSFVSRASAFIHEDLALLADRQRGWLDRSDLAAPKPYGINLSQCGTDRAGAAVRRNWAVVKAATSNCWPGWLGKQYRKPERWVELSEGVLGMSLLLRARSGWQRSTDSIRRFAVYQICIILNALGLDFAILTGSS
jgi:hypothetical protein